MDRGSTNHENSQMKLSRYGGPLWGAFIDSIDNKEHTMRQLLTFAYLKLLCRSEAPEHPLKLLSSEQIGT